MKDEDMEEEDWEPTTTIELLSTILVSIFALGIICIPVYFLATEYITHQLALISDRVWPKWWELAFQIIVIDFGVLLLWVVISLFFNSLICLFNRKSKRCCPK